MKTKIAALLLCTFLAQTAFLASVFANADALSSNDKKKRPGKKVVVDAGEIDLSEEDLFGAEKAAEKAKAEAAKAPAAGEKTKIKYIPIAPGTRNDKPTPGLATKETQSALTTNGSEKIKKPIPTWSPTKVSKTIVDPAFAAAESKKKADLEAAKAAAEKAKAQAEAAQKAKEEQLAKAEAAKAARAAAQKEKEDRVAAEKAKKVAQAKAVVDAEQDQKVAQLLKAATEKPEDAPEQAAPKEVPPQPSVSKASAKAPVAPKPAPVDVPAPVTAQKPKPTAEAPARASVPKSGLLPRKEELSQDPRVAGEQVVKGYQDIPALLQAAGESPDNCSIDPVVPLASGVQPKVTPQNACGKDFYNFACRDDSQKKQRADAVNAYDALQIKTRIGMVADSDVQKKLSNILELSKNRKGTFERDVARYDDLQAAYNSVDPASEAFKAAFSKELNDSVALKNTKNTFAEVQEYLSVILNTEKGQALSAAEVRSNVRDANARPFAEQKEFIEKSFETMQDLVKNVKFNPSLGESLCVRDQRNAFLKRNDDGSNELVVCPGLYLGGTQGAIAGAIASALAQAVDSCALDTKSVDMKNGTKVPLIGLLEPLRACVGDKLANKDRSNVMPMFDPQDPIEDFSRFAEGVRASVKGFAVTPGAPHCKLSYHSDDLAKGKTPRRDVSNSGVAQYFATKALVFWANEKAASKASAFVATRQFVADGFAPYCDSSANNISGLDPRKMLNGVVGESFELQNGGLQCKQFKERAAEEANTEKLTNLFALHGKTDKATITIENGAMPRGCDAQFRAGVVLTAARVAGPAAQQNLKLYAAAKEDPNHNLGVLVAPKKYPEVAKAQATQLQSSGQNSGTPQSENPTLRLSSDVLAKRHAQREAALDEARADCLDETKDNTVPFDGNQFDAACKKDSTAGGFLLLDYWAAKPREIKKDNYTFSIGCELRCNCEQRYCRSPQAVYKDSDPKITVANTVENRVADIAYALEKNPDKGRYGFAAKQCFNEKMPTLAVIKQECSSGKPTMIKNQGSILLVGENSGAEMSFGCSFECDCNDPSRCGVTVSPPDPNQALAVARNPLASQRMNVNYKNVSDVVALNVTGGAGPTPAQTDQRVPQVAKAALVTPMSGSSAQSGQVDYGNLKPAGQMFLSPVYEERLKIRLETQKQAEKICQNEFFEKAHGKSIEELCTEQGRVAFPIGLKRRGQYNTFEMKYSCGYNCETRSTGVVFAGQSPSIQQSLPNAYTSKIKESRESDWRMYAWNANQDCRRKIEQSEENFGVVAKSNWKGDLTGAFLMYRCDRCEQGEHCRVQATLLEPIDPRKVPGEYDIYRSAKVENQKAPVYAATKAMKDHYKKMIIGFGQANFNSSKCEVDPGDSSKMSYVLNVNQPTFYGTMQFSLKAFCKCPNNTPGPGCSLAGWDWN